MPTSIPFETAVEAVDTALTKKTKHLHLKTKKIIEEGDLVTAHENIRKKNFTLTSANQLAAILVKIIEIYVHLCKEDNAATFIKYIKLLQTENLDLLAVRKILKVLNLDKLTELIEKKYDDIAKEATNILKGVNFTVAGIIDKENSTEFGTTLKEITDKTTEIGKKISDATGVQLKSSELDVLLTVFKNIKLCCKKSIRTGIRSQKYLQAELLTSLSTTSLEKTISKDTLTEATNNLTNEFEYLKYVINHNGDENAEMLKKCHKDAVRKLLTAKRRIKGAYDTAGKAEKEEQDGLPVLGDKLITPEQIADENAFVIDTVTALLETEELKIDEIKDKLTGLANNGKIVALKPALEQVNDLLALNDFDIHLFLKEDALQGIFDEAYERLSELFRRARKINLVNRFNKLLNQSWTNHTDPSGAGTVNSFLHVISTSFNIYKRPQQIYNTYYYIKDIVDKNSWKRISDKATAISAEVGLDNLKIINQNLRELRDANK